MNYIKDETNIKCHRNRERRKRNRKPAKLKSTKNHTRKQRNIVKYTTHTHTHWACVKMKIMTPLQLWNASSLTQMLLANELNVHSNMCADSMVGVVQRGGRVLSAMLSAHKLYPIQQEHSWSLESALKSRECSTWMNLVQSPCNFSSVNHTKLRVLL